MASLFSCKTACSVRLVSLQQLLEYRRVIDQIRFHQHQQQQLFKLHGKAVDDKVGIRHPLLVGDEAKLHLVVIGEDGDTDTYVTRLGHPEQGLAQTGTGQIKGLLGTGHIGDDGAGLGRENIDGLLLQGLGGHTHYLQ